MSTVFAQKILNVQKQQMFIQLPTPRHRGYGQGGYHLCLRVLATCRAGRSRQREGIQALCKEIIVFSISLYRIFVKVSKNDKEASRETRLFYLYNT